MSDWIGAAFFVLLVVGIIAGLRALAVPRKRSAEDFERSVSEGTTGLGASVNALQEIFDPAAARAREVQMQMKDGRYQKKKREGKSSGPDHSGDEI